MPSAGSSFSHLKIGHLGVYPIFKHIQIQYSLGHYQTNPLKNDKIWTKIPIKTPYCWWLMTSWPHDPIDMSGCCRSGTWPEGSEQLLTSAPGTYGVPCDRWILASLPMASMAISKGNHLPFGKHLLVGGFSQNPSEKWWSLSLGMMTFPIYGQIKNVPHHQPVYSLRTGKSPSFIGKSTN